MTVTAALKGKVIFRSGETIMLENNKAKTRKTKQKETVITVFSAMRNHPTAEMVCDEVFKTDPSIGRATVYRILNALVKGGKAIKVPVYDGADRFDITVIPHSHAKCRSCGAVTDVVAEQRLPDVTESYGFLIEGGAVLYYGYCPECAEKTLKCGNANK